MCSSVSLALRSTKKGQLNYHSNRNNYCESSQRTFSQSGQRLGYSPFNGEVTESPNAATSPVPRLTFRPLQVEDTESQSPPCTSSRSVQVQSKSPASNKLSRNADNKHSKADENAQSSDQNWSMQQHLARATELFGAPITVYGADKYKEILAKKLQQFAKFDEKLTLQAEQQREIVKVTLLRTGKTDFQRICSIEQKHSEDVKYKQHQLYKSHKQSAKEQIARLEREKERIKSLEEEKQRFLVTSLTASLEYMLSSARELTALMATCRYPQHLSTKAAMCQSLMADVVGKNAAAVASAKNGDVDADYLIMVDELAKEARKIVSSMEVHVADANRRGDEEAAHVAASVAEEQQRQADETRKVLASARPASSSSATTATKLEPWTAAPVTPAITKTAPVLLPNVSDDVIQGYRSMQALLEQTTKNCESFTKDTRFNKDRFDLQKAINTPINGISPSNINQVLDKLCRLLGGQVVDIGSNRQVTAKKHEAGILFCKQLLAKKIVKQGEEQVSSNHDSAFQFAAIAVGVWCEFPDIGNLILASFHQICPYLVPYYPPMRENHGSREDYYRSLGYFIQENGEVEQQDKFLRRMSGFVRIYAAITVTQPPPRRGSSSVRPHPHGVENAWRWLAQTVNVEPRPDITATVLGDFLSVAGHALHRSYGRQFVKLVRLIGDDYMPKIMEVTQPGSGGPVTRLEGLLRDAVAGKLPRAPSNVDRTSSRTSDNYY